MDKNEENENTLTKGPSTKYDVSMNKNEENEKV